MNQYDFIIYHKNCLDGFSSLVVLNTTSYIKHDATIYPDVPSASFPPSNIDNKNIIIMDVAYKYEILKEIVQRAKNVLFIDHHVTIHDDVNKINETQNDKLKLIYNEKQCGSSLTWKYFYPSKQLPLFLKYIRDNDTGSWTLKHTHSFIATLNVKYDTTLSYTNIKKWNNLFDNKHVKKMIKRGHIYQEYINYLFNTNAGRYSMMAFPSEKIYEKFTHIFKKPAQYKVAVVCGNGCPNISLLGSYMADKINCDFVIFWNLHLDKKEYVLAFRSKLVDVGSIATIFGGGGHKLAAACSFSMTKYNITDLFMADSLGRSSRSSQ
jgi:oligoribonuclease NrnB/cAMP/cGMP phosphodiesterase (DHH superfamily)